MDKQLASVFKWMNIDSLDKSFIEVFSFAKNYLYDIKETIISFRNRKN